MQISPDVDAVSHRLGHGLKRTTGVFDALLVVGALSLVVNQLAYRAGPLRRSLPIITTIDPITATTML